MKSDYIKIIGLIMIIGLFIILILMFSCKTIVSLTPNQTIDIICEYVYNVIIRTTDCIYDQSAKTAIYSRGDFWECSIDALVTELPIIYRLFADTQITEQIIQDKILDYARNKGLLYVGN